MKKFHTILIVFFILFFLPLILHSQVMQEWIKFYYNSSRYAQGQFITQDTSGNIIVAGNGGGQNFAVIKYDNTGTQKWIKIFNTDPLYSSPDCLIADKYGDIYFSYTSWISDFVFIKISKDGVILWQRTYSSPSSGNRQIIGVVLTSSGYPIFCGTLPFAGTKEDFFMIKYSPSGDSLWTARYNSLNNNSDNASSLAIGKDGSLLISGYRVNYASGINPSFLTVKYDSNGVFKWARTYGNPDSSNSLYDGAFDNNGNVYVTGELNQKALCTIKYDASGDLKWVRTYSNTSSTNPYAIRTDNLGNVIVTALNTSSFERYVTTVKYDSLGNQLWVNSLTEISTTSTMLNNRNCINLDSSNNIYLTGTYYIRYQSPAQLGIFTANINSDGSLHWFKTFYGNKKYDYGGYGVVVDNYRSVYIVGTTQDSLNGFGFVTIKYSQPTAITQIKTEIPNNYKLFQNYPNPFNNTTKIQYQVPENSLVQLKVFDILGREVSNLVNEFQNPGTYETSFNAQDLASSIYIYELKVINQDKYSIKFREVKRMVLIK